MTKKIFRIGWLWGAAVMMASALTLNAQQRIDVKDFTERSVFRPKYVSSFRWMKDGAYYSALEDNRIVVYDVRNGAEQDVLLDASTFEQKIEIEDYTFSSDERRVLLTTHKERIYRYSYTAIYYLYDFEAKTLIRLSEGRASYATFSPTGEKVAYVSENNLYYYEVDTKETHQVTQDGKLNEVINGSGDWVYEEELTLVRGFEWSSDGNRIAYYRFDERKVPAFTMQMWKGVNPYPYDYTFKYPKAGATNSEVEIYIYDLKDQSKKSVDIGKEKDIYIPRIHWTEDPLLLSLERLNRLQNKRELLHVDALTGASKVVLSEESRTYVDFNFCDDLRYLKNGKHFIYSSEESGFKHFYLYNLSGRRIRSITSGQWEAERLVGVDERRGSAVLYFLSTEDGFMERKLYSVSVKGGDRTLLTAEKGVHHINMSPDCSYYLDYYSSPTLPLQIRLYATEGNRLIKVLEENKALQEQIKAYQLVEKEYFSFSTKSNDLLYGYLLKPRGMDASKKYPVLVYQYSGPGAQSVYKNWGGSHYAFHQMLTQRDVVVAVVDTRGTGGRGAAFKKATYATMGRYESEDLNEAAIYLAQLPYVDKQRIGIWGWSYGGYMSSLALFLPNSPYALAIAVAPVGSWRFYDTIYTERYLRKPEENPSGYDDYSPVTHAKTMSGAYLLVHGTGDDNVHFQNAIAIQDALLRSGKQFSSFYYPNEAHALFGVRTHLYQMMTDFIVKHLK